MGRVSVRNIILPDSMGIWILIIAILIISVPAGQAYGQEAYKYDIVLASQYISGEAGNQLLNQGRTRAFELYDQPDEFYSFIMIDPDKTFQTIEGFGGAFTDASAVNYGKLTAAQKEQFLTACFDPVNGNGYTYCRTTIHSCDYSDEIYTYAEVPGDKNLEHFTIDHDRTNRIPMIQAALKKANNNMKIFASPWSPPAWMKTNNDILHGGQLLPEYRQTWADYFVKYLKAYKDEGINLTGLTVQNETMATQLFESCVFTAVEERDFIRDYLGPALEKNGFGGVELMIYDHNRGIMYQRAEVVYEDPEASKYVTGMAFHWYSGNHYDNVKVVHDAWPDKKLVFSEAHMNGSWSSGIRAAQNIILDLNNGTNAWTFWNMMLDEKGGPYHLGGNNRINTQSAIITYDTRTGETADQSITIITLATSRDSSSRAQNGSPALLTTIT